MLVEKDFFLFPQIAKMAFFQHVRKMLRKETLDCTLCSIRIDLTFVDVIGKHHKVWNSTAVFRNRWEFMPSHRYNPSKISGQGLAEVYKFCFVKGPLCLNWDAGLVKWRVAVLQKPVKDVPNQHLISLLQPIQSLFHSRIQFFILVFKTAVILVDYLPNFLTFHVLQVSQTQFPILLAIVFLGLQPLYKKRNAKIT